MQAATFYRYGDASQLQIETLPMPNPGERDVRIKVIATSLNGSDFEFLRGKPAYARIIGMTKPKKHILGSDIAGIVESVGAQVTDFKPGDAVFCDNFDRLSGLAEYVCVPENKVVHKPHALSFVETSTLPQAGVIALQSLQKYGAPTEGQHILINGAGGAAGSFAVQMAKAMGAQVTAIDHQNKLEYLSSLGADFAYAFQSLPGDMPHRFDKIIDLVGHQPLSVFKSWLQPAGTYLIVGGRLRDIFGTLFMGSFWSMTGSQKFSVLAHQQNESDMLAVAEWVESGRIHVRISDVFSLRDVQKAFAKAAESTVFGKLVIQMQPEPIA